MQSMQEPTYYISATSCNAKKCRIHQCNSLHITSIQTLLEGEYKTFFNNFHRAGKAKTKSEREQDNNRHIMKSLHHTKPQWLRPNVNETEKKNINIPHITIIFKFELALLMPKITKLNVVVLMGAEGIGFFEIRV